MTEAAARQNTDGGLFFYKNVRHICHEPYIHWFQYGWNQVPVRMELSSSTDGTKFQYGRNQVPVRMEPNKVLLSSVLLAFDRYSPS